MKKIISVFLALIAFSVSVSYAQSETISTIPTGIMLTGGTVSSVPDPDDSSKTVILFSASSTSELWIPIEAINGGKIELSYRIRWQGQGSNIIRLPMLTTNKQNIFIPQLHINTLAISNIGGMNHFPTNGENTWNKLKFIIDTEALKYDIYVNDVKKTPYTGENAGKYFSFSSAVLSELDGIKLQLSSGSAYISDICVERTGDGEKRTILFNSSYNVNHTEKTIGKFPYLATKAEILESLRLKNGVTADLSTAGEYVKNGDILTVYDSIYDQSFDYTVSVRSRNISKSFFGVMKKSLILKENSFYGYSNAELITDIPYQNGAVKKEVLNKFGVSAERDCSLSELSSYGLYPKIKNGYLIIQKSDFKLSPFWIYELNCLF